MRWTVEDMEKFEQEREFVDTALIPIFSFPMDQVSLDVTKEQKWLEEICVYAERQLTGRVLLLPTLYVIDQEWPLNSVTISSFPIVQFVTTNEQLQEKLGQLNVPVYLLERKEQEDDLTEMVREGKKLTKRIMEQWKN